MPNPITSLPAIGGLLAGTPPALSMDLKTMPERPEGQAIAQAAPQLFKAGISIYKSLDGTTGVLFNSGSVDAATLKKADKAGTLADIAPDFDAVNAQLGSGTATPSEPAGLPAQAPAPAMPIPPAPAQVPGRQAALTPKAPSKGARPGQGRLMNAMATPVR